MDKEKNSMEINEAHLEEHTIIADKLLDIDDRVRDIEMKLRTKNCEPKSEIKFDITIRDKFKTNRIAGVCGQDLADIIESATKTGGVNVAIVRSQE